jgi:uncharacterized OB-fold protein
MSSFDRTDGLGRIAPLADEVSAPYWAATAEGRLLLQRCPDGRYQWPPRGRPVPALDGEPEWVESSGRGTVYTYSVVHRSTHPYPEVPYVMAIVELEEGVFLTTNVMDVDPETVAIGLPVRVSFEQSGSDLALPVFVPDPERAS